MFFCFTFITRKYASKLLFLVYFLVYYIFNVSTPTKYCCNTLSKGVDINLVKFHYANASFLRTPVREQFLQVHLFIMHLSHQVQSSKFHIFLAYIFGGSPDMKIKTETPQTTDLFKPTQHFFHKIRCIRSLSLIDFLLYPYTIFFSLSSNNAGNRILF